MLQERRFQNKTYDRVSLCNGVDCLSVDDSLNRMTVDGGQAYDTFKFALFCWFSSFHEIILSPTHNIKPLEFY